MSHVSFIFKSTLCAVFLLLPSSLIEACAQPSFQPAAAAAAATMASDARLPQKKKNRELREAASAWKSVDDMDYWLKRGAAVNARDKSGNTALILCAGQVAKVLLLLNYKSPLDVKVDINAKSNNGSTALIMAAYTPKTVKLLLNHQTDCVTGINIDARLAISDDSPYNGTALTRACQAGVEESVKLLLNYRSPQGIGVDVNAGSIEPEHISHSTALACAGVNGHEEVARLLLSSHYIQPDQPPSIRQKNLDTLRQITHYLQNNVRLTQARADIRAMIEKAVEAAQANEPEIFLSTLAPDQRADYEEMMKEQRANSLAVFKRKTMRSAPPTISIATMLARREAGLPHTHRKFMPRSIASPAGLPFALPSPAAAAAAARPELEGRVDKLSDLLLEMDK